MLPPAGRDVHSSCHGLASPIWLFSHDTSAIGTGPGGALSELSAPCEEGEEEGGPLSRPRRVWSPLMRHLTNPTGGILYKLFCCCCVRIYTLFTLAVFTT